MNLLLEKTTLLFLISLLVKQSIAFECNLPNGCFIKTRKYGLNHFTYEKATLYYDSKEIKCKSNKEFKFDFVENEYMVNHRSSCILSNKDNFETISFEWSKHNDLIILDKRFDLENMMAYLKYFHLRFNIQFVNLKGVDINLTESNSSIIENNSDVSAIICIACKMNFYSNGKLIKSCQDISTNPNSTIMSIFQIKLNGLSEILIKDSDYTTNVCPLVFKNANIKWLYLTGLFNSFYKKNTLKFSNDNFSNLNSTIYGLELNKVENIDLDLMLLNPSVFSELNVLTIYGSLKSIDKRLFSTFPHLRSIDLHSAYFRKLIHENGIDWIKEINRNQMKVDIRYLIELYKLLKYELSIKYIDIQCNIDTQQEPLFEVFPDEDFCAYKDFPFDQLVVLIQFCDSNKLMEVMKKEEFTCTYLWITQYLGFYYEYYALNTTVSNNIKKIIESKSFKDRSKCNFDHRLELCNKTNYKIENIWSTIDYYYLNKKLQISFKITSYLVSIFGITSNLLIVIIILIKSNSELFKEFKHYTYLCINSIFCLMILVINILSWTTECFYPFEVFCPEIRKIVFIQFFKIIFKECLTTTFRFMLNFSYVAFALSRIALIKKDQNKFLKFISDVSIYKYIGVSLMISVGLSAMKFFKYEVNYEYPFMNYPISNEWDIFDVNYMKSHTFDDAYFIMNSISDIINYVIFVLICVFIDIFMVVELRHVMSEKLQKIEQLYAESKTKIESAKKENDDAINKVIRMVVINTAIGVLFKMPIAFISILNAYAALYYKRLENRYIHPTFGRFYSSLFFNGFYGQFSDFADFLFILSISIQPLIFKHFDKKIQSAFERLFHKNHQTSILAK